MRTELRGLVGTLLLGGLLFGGAGCGEAAVSDTAGGEVSAATEPAPLEVTTVAGERFEPLRPEPGHLVCMLFVTVDCPIANKYAPEIAAIAGDHAGDPLRIVLVHVDPDVDAARAREHAAEYGLDVDLVLDPAHRLVAATGVTITPEAAVYDHTGTRLYRGRIDDRFGRLGSRRPQPSHRDLRDALAAALRGERPDPAETDAVGCIIADFR